MDRYPTSFSSTGVSALAFIMLAGAVAISMAAVGLVLVQQRSLLKETRRQLSENSARRDVELKRLASDVGMREAQLKRFAAGREIREAQLQRMAEVRTKGEAAMKELAAARLQRENAVKQSAELQKKFQDLVLDLLLLAKTDSDAKAIATKYNIQQTLPTEGGTALPK